MVRLPSLRNRLRGRLLLAAVGVAMLVLGVMTAWRERASTSLLAIGAVLCVLGFFDWSEIQAKHGDTELILKAREAKEKLDEAVARDDVPADLKVDLGQTASELDELLATRDAQLQRPYIARPRQGGSQPKRDTVPRAWHAVHNGSVLVTFRQVPTSKPVYVALQGPDGAIVRSTERLRSESGEVTVLYPDDFENAHEVGNGEFTASLISEGADAKPISLDQYSFRIDVRQAH